MPDTWTHHRARYAALSRDRSPDDPELLAARHDLAAARLADAVARTVSKFGPLTAEQRDRIAALLAPAPDTGPGDAT